MEAKEEVGTKREDLAEVADLALYGGEGEKQG